MLSRLRFLPIIGALLALVLGSASGSESLSPVNQQGLIISQGDIIVKRNEGGTWDAIKILQVDVFPAGDSTAHCLVYEPPPAKPTVASAAMLPVRIWHAPINARSFSVGWERIGTQAVSKEELVGFIEYLKLTNFPRYLSFTGQDAKVVVRKANEHYQRAYALGDQGKRTEAIAEYSLAIESFPLFYEAIDNRAFTYMELGQYAEALTDFETSLRVNPGGVSAFFSKGECLLRLGQLPAAEAVFAEGLARFPENRAMFQKYLELTRSMRKGG